MSNYLYVLLDGDWEDYVIIGIFTSIERCEDVMINYYKVYGHGHYGFIIEKRKINCFGCEAEYLYKNFCKDHENMKLCRYEWRKNERGLTEEYILKTIYEGQRRYKDEE